MALGLDLSAQFVVCGVDNSEARVAVSRYYRRLGTPVIFIAVDLLAECGHEIVVRFQNAVERFAAAFLMCRFSHRRTE